MKNNIGLLPCCHCGGMAEIKSEENYSAHTFWRVICSRCGRGTWYDNKGYGYEDDPGRKKAIAEWNRKNQ